MRGQAVSPATKDETPFGISQAEERSLLRRIARGDEAAHQRLLGAFEPLVAAAARRYAPPGSATYEDLCQQGRIGLLGAVKAYKAGAETRFGAYAKSWVEGAVKKGVAASGSETLGLEADKLALDEDGQSEGASAEAGEEEGEAPGRRGAGHVTVIGELVGGQASGRDAYLLHAADEFADVAHLFGNWLAQEGHPEEINPRVWTYLQRAEHELLVRAREVDTLALAQLQQKYDLACELLLPDGRPRRSEGLVIEPDARSAALAALVAQAVSAGSLPERAWHAAKATQGTAPARGPGFPEVTECRTRLLPAGLIDPSRVASWIEAQAAREGGPAGAYLKVPLTEAEQETLGQNGGHARASYAALLGALAGRLAGEAEGELPATILEWPELLTYENPGGKPRLLRIRGDRELAFLKTVARSLTGHFDCWSEPEAVAFVLSGWVPPLAKLRARTRRGLYRAASRITYDVDPRTSPAALAEFHRRLRRRWVEGRDRLLGDKALALAVFADAAWQPGASWEELKERWNREHPPGDALHSELPTNQFATECRGAWERLTNEIWPQGSRAARHLRAELDAVRAKRRREAGTGLEGPPT